MIGKKLERGEGGTEREREGGRREIEAHHIYSAMKNSLSPLVNTALSLSSSPLIFPKCIVFFYCLLFYRM